MMARAKGLEPLTSQMHNLGALPTELRAIVLLPINSCFVANQLIDNLSLPQRQTAERLPHSFRRCAGWDSDGHRLAVALTDELELDPVSEQFYCGAQELALVAHSECDGVGA
jgi:hypothetical protein